MESTCSGCGKQVSGSDVLYSADARVLCPACYGKADLAATVARGKGIGVAGVGAAAGLIPFVANVSTVEIHVVNSVAQVSYRDWLAVGCGGFAIICGVLAVIGALKGRRVMVLAGIAVAALGGYQIARGLGMFYQGAAAYESLQTEEHDAIRLVMDAAEPVADPKHPEACPARHDCFELGRSLEETRDFAPAVVAYARACDFGASGGCHNAATLLTNGEAGPADYAKANPFYEKGCALDDATDCSELATQYLQGTGVLAKDYAKAKPLLEKACAKGSPIACSNLGIVYRDGMGEAKDPAKAMAQFERGCNMEAEHPEDTAAACGNAGAMLVEGDVKHDPQMAFELLGTACERDTAHCFGLAVANLNGVGTKKDAATARELFGKACTAKNADACFQLAELLAHGTGGSKDAAKALEIYQQACDGGAEDACKKLPKK